jgi:hypothetical protein
VEIEEVLVGADSENRESEIRQAACAEYEVISDHCKWLTPYINGGYLRWTGFLNPKVWAAAKWITYLGKQWIDNSANHISGPV